ncbi:hypothetical protein ACFVY0_46115 [Streptomyces sp. NPDC058286]|uniref:hypothetical protein n=1 Tax=Streptomyces sp. NPDC058286 TaxID=3346422 RepID=UPI0036EFF1F1
MLLAESLSRLLLIDVSELSPKQEAKYNGCFADIATIAGDDRVADERLQELARHDAPLADYLYALRVSGLIRHEPDPDGILVALRHLRTHTEAVNDKRCIRRLLDLFWLAKTVYRFMGGERLILPLSQRDWSECLELAGQLQAADELSLLRVEFMRALTLFRLGQLSSAFDSFRRADQQSYACRRDVPGQRARGEASHLPPSRAPRRP